MHGLVHQKYEKLFVDKKTKKFEKLFVNEKGRSLIIALVIICYLSEKKIELVKVREILAKCYELEISSARKKMYQTFKLVNKHPVTTMQLHQ